jgi:hypothetical protein
MMTTRAGLIWCLQYDTIQFHRIFIIITSTSPDSYPFVSLTTHEAVAIPGLHQLTSLLSHASSWDYWNQDIDTPESKLQIEMTSATFMHCVIQGSTSLLGGRSIMITLFLPPAPRSFVPSLLRQKRRILHTQKHTNPLTLTINARQRKCKHDINPTYHLPPIPSPRYWCLWRWMMTLFSLFSSRNQAIPCSMHISCTLCA